MTRVVSDAGAIAALAFSPELMVVSMRKAGVGAATAQRFARVDTGAMRAGIHAEPIAGGARVTGSTDHDIYNEFGTRNMSAQPMFRPSMPAAAAG